MNLDLKKSLSFSSNATIAFSVALCSLVRGLKITQNYLDIIIDILKNNFIILLFIFYFIFPFTFRISFHLYSG